MRGRTTMAVLLAAAVVASAARAADFPKRRAGLWEIDTVAAQAAGLPSARYCIGEHTDRAERHLDRGAADQGACRTGAFRRAGNAWLAESVCREGRTNVRSRSVASGDFETAYRIDTTVTYDPPLGGVRREESTATVGRWLGPCAPDQKAGDVIIPGMGRLNMVDGDVRPEPERPPPPRRRGARQQDEQR